MKKVLERIEELQDETVAHRRYLHQYPEVGFDSAHTEKYIRTFLEGENIQILDTEWGVLGLIHGKDHENVIALRADMDGLAIVEQLDSPYRSKIEGKMHACGHDGHMAMLLTAAKVLNENRDKLNSDVLIIFQPSEEGPYSGAKPLSEELHKMDIGSKIKKVCALHVTNEFEVGQIGLKYGSAMASTDNIDLLVKGKGGHAGLPHKTVDAISIGCKVIHELESYVARRVNPSTPLTLSFGEFHSGKWRSIINEEAMLKGTLRCHSEKDRKEFKEGITKLIKETCSAWGATCELTIEEGVPPVCTDTVSMRSNEKIARELVGDENVIIIEESKMTAEDFSYFGRYWPITFMWLGTGNAKKGITVSLHNPYFDMDEEGLLTGAKFHCMIALLDQ